MINKYNRLFRRTTALFITVIFIVTMIIPTQSVHAQSTLSLPQPGTMVMLSASYTSPIVTGITFYPDNPLKFDFLIHQGDDLLEGDEFQEEAQKLINYFMATLTVPEDEMWVNLSPYEKN